MAAAPVPWLARRRRPAWQAPKRPREARRSVSKPCLNVIDSLSLLLCRSRRTGSSSNAGPSGGPASQCALCARPTNPRVSPSSAASACVSPPSRRATPRSSGPRRRATPAHSRVFTVARASRSLAAGTASAYCGSHCAWATTISSTICQTSSGVQMAPTSGSCSTASFSRSISPEIAAWTDMRCTLIDEMQVAAQASGKRDPSHHVDAETIDEAGRFNDRVFEEDW